MNSLPQMCYQNLVINKKKFKNNRQSFTDKVQRIKLLYVINEKTINIIQDQPTDEIVVIELSLKQKQIPQDVIKHIETSINKNILYQIVYNNQICLGFYDDKLFTTKWNEELKFDYSSKTINSLYKSMCSQILGTTLDYEHAVELEKQKQELQKNIESLEQQKIKEKQMDRKLIIRDKIRKLKQELEILGD